ncbi:MULTISPECIES: MFS transporter [Klebsiella]|uniref:MFS transporter n=1 Tax=Klebsiella michiganensis TaxID=1134687 RepID=A0AB35PQY3_9ENTR|nr:MULTISPECIES: MFS transporter [Klebsiella]CAH6272095.1 Inner membrane transport protein YnfM [Klebsiella oxytoca]AFN31786.1 putative permease [Klebsiella michiganensis E718]AIE69719.1 permease [Klebsiella michiganensis]ASK76755.1 MFS transporter [Klebsiella michiganensis]ASZ54056.1 MFS transporter [Klebsiella michiganensis]
MAITHTKDNQLNSAPVKVSNYIRIILALALSGLAELASLFFIQPLLPVLAVEYDVPVSQVSIILSAETALLAIGLLFTGTLSDHYGRKKLIIVSLLLGGLLTMLCPLVESWAMLVALRAVIGLALSGIAAAATAYISEEVAPVVAGVVTGYFVFGNSMGGMSGRIVASQLIDHISINTIFYGFAISLILVALLVYFLLPASQNFKPTQSLNVLRVVKGAASHFKNKKLALAFVISFIIFGVFTSLYNYLAFFLKGEPFHISPANAGLLSFSFALSFFTAPQAGRLSAKYGSMRVLRALFVMMALGMLLTLTSNVVTFIIGAVIFTGCFFGCHSIGLSWVSKNATHARGQAVALYLFFYYMGGSVIGFVNGFVFHSMGWQGMTGFIIALLAVGAVVATYLSSSETKVMVPVES